MPVRPLAASLVALLLLTSCGGSDGDSSAEDTTTTTATRGRATEPVTIALAAQVHYAGFLLDLEEATHDDTHVLVTGTAENLGSGTSQPPSNVTLKIGKQTVELDDFISEMDDVPGDSVGEITYAFGVGEDADITDAVLYIGGADFARAVVPFGSVEELIDNEPVEVELTGEVVAGSSTFTIEGGEVRFDVPDRHDPAEAGKAYLTLRFTVTNNSDFAGGYAFTHEDLRLKTPKGISLAPDDAPIELLAPSSSLPDLTVRWLIDADAPGTYTFIGLRNVGTDTQSQGELEFELPDLA